MSERTAVIVVLSSTAIAGMVVGAALVGFGHGLSPPRARISCLPDGRLIHNVEVEGMDDKAFWDSVFYLCDPETIGFGYRNPQVRRVRGQP